VLPPMCHRHDAVGTHVACPPLSPPFLHTIRSHALPSAQNEKSEMIVGTRGPARRIRFLSIALPEVHVGLHRPASRTTKPQQVQSSGRRTLVAAPCTRTDATIGIPIDGWRLVRQSTIGCRPSSTTCLLWIANACPGVQSGSTCRCRCMRVCTIAKYTRRRPLGTWRHLFACFFLLTATSSR